MKTIVIQAAGGTRKSIAEGRALVAEQRAALDAAPTVPMAVDELVVGTVCGGSDGTRGITGNPAAGRAFDLLVEEGAACIFEETGELIGCEHIMAARAVTPELGDELRGERRQGGALLRDAGLRLVRARQCRRRADDHRGEVDGRLCQVRRTRRSPA